MTPRDVLAAHAATTITPWRVAGRTLDLATKTGVRGAPGPDPALAVLAEALGRGRAAPSGAPLLDATGSQGPIAAYARGEGVAARVLVASAAAWRTALATGTAADDLLAGFAWDLPPGSLAEVWWRPAGDRGTLRLEAELLGWARALAPGGVLWGLWHKDEGGNRAERLAASTFDDVEVVNRASGWRLVSLRTPRTDAPPPTPWREWPGPDGTMRSVVGTYAGTRLDPGTAVLLDALAPDVGPDGGDARVLDLGCGTGVLARRASARGAREVIALDDDLGAVLSTRAALDLPAEVADATAAAATVAAGAIGDGSLRRTRVVWSDLLGGTTGRLDADLVLMNPPFHVGKQVVGALSRAFVAAALEALRPGGRLLMVANRALPYERDLAAWASWRDVTPHGAKGFKVLDARVR